MFQSAKVSLKVSILLVCVAKSLACVSKNLWKQNDTTVGNVVFTKNNFLYLRVQNGYKMRVLSVENCIKNPTIAVDANFTANLSPKCIVTSSGCITSKGFEQAKV